MTAQRGGKRPMRRTTGRRALLGVLCAVLLGTSALAAPGDGAELERPDVAYGESETGFAADFDYSGVLDPATGLPALGAAASAQDGVSLAEGVRYDASAGRFIVSTAAGEFRCTAVDGMVTTQPVSIEPNGTQLTVYRDGTEVASAEYGSLALPGEYVVYAGSGDEGRGVMSFTVVGRVTNRIYGYSVPEGFFVRRALWNGEEMGFERYFVNMEGEGDYLIEYRSPTADLTYTLETSIDRTPPELAVSGKLGRDGRVHSAVTFRAVDENGEIDVIKDGAPYRASYTPDGSGTLAEPGEYTLSITDEAGNRSTYDFEIMVYLDSHSIVFLALLLGVVGTVAGLAIWKRKNFRTY